MGLRGPLPRSSQAAPPRQAEPMSPPSWLPAEAKRVWLEVEPRLRASGRLRPEHADTLGQWAACVAELRELVAVIEAEGSTCRGPHGTTPSAAHTAACRLRATMLALGKSLGLDPLSAARLDALAPPASAEPDALAEFAARRNRPSDDPAEGQRIIDMLTTAR